MYKSIEAIEQLRNEKMKVLNQVYAVKDIDEIYRRQTALNEMAIGIYTDASGVLLQSLPQDGVKKSLWSKISAGLGQLNFIGIPREDELKSDYYKAMKDIKEEKDEYTIEPEEPLYYKPKTNVQFEVKTIPLPAFIATIAGQGIAVPLVIKVAGAGLPALVRIFGYCANALLMTVEVVMYINKVKKIKKAQEFSKKVKRVVKEKINGNNYNEGGISENTNQKLEQWIAAAIKKVQRDNQKILNDWFDNLKALTKQCIEQATEQE